MRRIKTTTYLYFFATLIFFFSGNTALANHSILHSASEHPYPPLAVTDDNGEASGFSVELLKAVLKNKDQDVDFYIDSWAAIKNSLEKGDLDVLPLVARTPEREKVFDFTVPYLSSYGNLYTRTDDIEINSIYDLRDKELILMEDDNAHEFALREGLSKNIITTKNFEQAFELLSQGKHDAIICLDIVGKRIINNLDINNVSAKSKLSNYRQDYSFAVKKGNQQLLATLNDGLSKTISDGTYDFLYKKWFNTEEENFLEKANYETEAKLLANEIVLFLDNIVSDTQEVANFDFLDLNKTKQSIKNFYNNKFKDIWVNIGSDENVISQVMNLNLYREISYVDETGVERIKYKDGSFENDLRDVSNPQNTYFKSETFWKDTRHLPRGKVFISKLHTDYISKDEVFADLDKKYYNKYEKVIARDIMKNGYIRFSSPVYIAEEFKGIISLALDYRHLQELVKHIEPGNPNKVISASYTDNYILMYDIDGNTIVHPKPDNIRGYLADGTLAGYNEEHPDKEGNIFNLYAYQKSMAYPNMAKKTLEEKGVYTSSALDVSGRTKLTIAVPISYNNSDTNYADLGVFGGIMMSISVFEERNKSIEKISTKLKALETAKDIASYLQANPGLSLEELQKDTFFKKIAIQKVNENGYTSVLDSTDGTFYFHPQEKLINQKPSAFKDELPGWWQIINNSIGTNCQESDGEYRWKEVDGEITEKYLYTACVKTKTADKKNLLVIATSYLNEADANKYVQKYSIGNEYIFARDFIKQRAFDIGRQIEIYIEANPEKTLADLKKDPIFQETAVQSIGRTGYTYLVNHNNGSMDFHPDPKIQNYSYNNFKNRFPVIWGIINKSVVNKNCEDSEGFYEWADIHGEVRDKYTYHHCLDAVTADGYSFLIGASTYLDEYDLTEQTSKVNLSENNEYSFLTIFAYSIAALLAIILIFLFLFYFKIITFQGVTLYVLLAIVFTFISFLFLASSYLTANNLETFLKNNYINQSFEKLNAFKVLLKKDFEHMDRELLNLSERLAKEDSANIDIEYELKKTKESSEDFVYASYRIDKDSVITQMYPIDDKSLNANIGDQEHMIKIQNTLRPVTSNIFDAVEGFKAVSSHYPVFKNNSYDGTVAVLINVDSLLDDLDLMEYQENKEDFYILDSAFNIISSEKKENIGKKVSELTEFNEIEIISVLENSANTNFYEYSDETEAYVLTFSPVYIEDNTWYLLQKTSEEQIINSSRVTFKNIWLYTFLTLISLAILGFGSSFMLTRSLKREIKKRTKEINNQSQQIKDQLEREANINNVNKRLIKEQKEAKQELEEKVDELEKFQKLIVNREIKMIELKEEISKLKKENK